MTSNALDDIYEIASRLPATDRLRLVERIARDLSTAATQPDERHSWMEIAAIAPDLLAGEDAQELISRSRRESDQRRGGMGEIA